MSNVEPLLAAGNVAEVFEWGSRVVKLYRAPAAKQAAFREAGTHAVVEAMGLPYLPSGVCSGSTLAGASV